MPHRQVVRMCVTVRTFSKELIIIISVQMMYLHEPHEMHRVHSARKSAIRLMDVIAELFVR